MSGTETAVFRRLLILDTDPRAWAAAPALLLVACDDAYVQHVVSLARSLEVFSPGAHLLVHLVNPTQAVLAQLRDLSSRLWRTQLHLSAERTFFPDSEARVPYYASARFLRLRELIKQPGAIPVLALDADALAVSPIDWKFSEKPEAEICLRRRDLESDDVDLHLRVAAGAVWVKPTKRALGFMDAVANDLLKAFADHNPGWFIDQKVLADHVTRRTAHAAVRNINPKYVDWQFLDEAVFWMGKGDRKYLDVRYLLLREALQIDGSRRAAAANVLSMMERHVAPGQLGTLGDRLHLASRDFNTKPKVAVFLPRLDLPFKREGMGRDGMPPVQAAETVSLRLWWMRFSLELVATLVRHGLDARLVELPAWEIDPQRIDAEGVQLAFVPHRCRLDFTGGETPVWFYMQEFFRSVFVLDPHGWSASSSIYPVDPDTLPAATLGVWDRYRSAFDAGTLDSKFGQNESASKLQLEESGGLPSGPYVFFPLQVPHDQSLRYFSDVAEMDAVIAAHELCKATGRTLVLKEHPANRSSMQSFRERFDGPVVHWSEGNIHDILKHADAVITLNSGVGFEALLANRPLITLARVEYDAVSHKAVPNQLRNAFEAAIAESDDARASRYARFVDWFLGRHAVDLSRPEEARRILDRLVVSALQSLGNPI
ncbi:MAG: hypothetical protein ACREO0_01865 [Pseudoxanthomonas sp.]